MIPGCHVWLTPQFLFSATGPFSGETTFKVRWAGHRWMIFVANPTHGRWQVSRMESLKNHIFCCWYLFLAGVVKFRFSLLQCLFFSLVFFHSFLAIPVETFKISSAALAEVLRPTQRQWEVGLGSSIDSRHGETKWPRWATGVLPSCHKVI